MHNYILDLIIFLVAAVVMVPVFKKLKLGAILAYLFAGILIGPQAFELIEDPAVILNFSELGIILLLFIIGLELNPIRLWNMKRDVFGMGLLQVLLSGSLFSLIAYNLNIKGITSIIIGLSLALSSTAFGIQILQENRQLKTIHGRSSFSILLFQDLAVVPLIALIPIMGRSSSKGLNYLNFLFILSLVSLFILLGRFIVKWGLRQVAEARVQEVFTATALLIVIGTSYLMELAGLSKGMGAFLAGMMLANSEYRHEIQSDLQPFKGLLMGLFFIAIGMSLNLNIISKYPHIIISLVFSFMFLKGLIVYVIARLFKYPPETSRNIAFTLPQGGEFAFVLFASATSNSLLDKPMASLLNASVTISMALTPLLFALNQKFFRTYSEISEKPLEDIGPVKSKIIIAGYGRFGQIIARFLKSMNYQPIVLEHDANKVETAIEYGTIAYYGDASRIDILQAIGAMDAEIFVLAVDQKEASIKIAKQLKNHFPHLKIIARAHNRQHALELMDVGIADIHRDTFLTSLEVAREVLLSLGEDPNEIEQYILKFRRIDEDILRKQFHLRNDDKMLRDYDHYASLELETILKEDRAHNSKSGPQIP